MQRIRQDDHGFFYKFFRKAPQLLDKLLSFLAEALTRQHHIRETPGAWRTTCCSIEKQCFLTYPAYDCLLKPAMLLTADCCGVPQNPQEPELLETSVIQEILKCPETPQTHATPKTESMLALVTSLDGDGTSKCCQIGKLAHFLLRCLQHFPPHSMGALVEGWRTSCM
ncbi:uncharacterized protein LOC142568060 [Dermacentor variabilis]|uniref:uncharacterized protein LOC142568060 n=1 Tax=Dermacentor variabilis TaxID=34621 RepID=UPI003F5C0441